MKQPWIFKLTTSLTIFFTITNSIPAQAQIFDDPRVGTAKFKAHLIDQPIDPATVPGGKSLIIFRQVPENKPEQGSLQIGNERALNVQWSVRGGSRSQDPIPLIKFVFEKNRSGTSFENQDKKLKIVPHGTETAPIGDLYSFYNQHVVLEYVIYKMIEKTGVPFFRTKLMKLDYIDVKFGKLTTGYAIFLEHKDDFEKRMGWKFHDTEIPRLDPTFTRPTKVDQERTDLLEAYIGNTDYSLNGHNTCLFRQPDGQCRVVAYDFDLAALALKDSAFPETLSMLPDFELKTGVHLNFAENLLSLESEFIHIAEDPAIPLTEELREFIKSFIKKQNKTLRNKLNK